ncbi:hypothetical protein THMIRHAS_12430 [Thiosulfatimonas sediminis]|uniref:Uncharacterized protein n=1 Tax=Thiosulfatimonas sediminis TaxID=2675054 RepID=A0A6F8PV71_9GAMM|nr:hypothetical protein [Thiosulfatimonas sediminis]BBP45870.1 hypothetical protein THMIRHAS_12430 [Thiosulfatimonas sediminis]
MSRLIEFAELYNSKEPHHREQLTELSRLMLVDNLTAIKAISCDISDMSLHTTAQQIKVSEHAYHLNRLAMDSRELLEIIAPENVEGVA